MNRKEFEEKCLSAGLEDYQFCSIKEIENTLELNIEKIEGYTRLSRLDKEAYKNFIVNYINCVGIDSKITFKPIRVYKDEKLKVEYELDNKDELLNIINNGTEWY